MNCSGGQTDGTPLVRRRTGGESVTTAVVRAAATAEDTDARSLRPLGEVVDPEALERLLGEADTGAHVTFSYAGHRVVATDEAVEVY